MSDNTEPLNINGLIRDSREIMLLLGVTAAADVLPELKKRLGVISDTVTVTTREYLNLVRSDLELDALDAGGVDNWEGYGEVDWEAIEAGVAEAEAKLGGAR